MSEDMKDNNVVYLNKHLRLLSEPVPAVCEIAGELMQDVVILGTAKDGTIKMMTTQGDVADILFYLESAKFAIMQGEDFDGD